MFLIPTMIVFAVLCLVLACLQVRGRRTAVELMKDRESTGRRLNSLQAQINNTQNRLLLVNASITDAGEATGKLRTRVEQLERFRDRLAGLAEPGPFRLAAPSPPVSPALAEMQREEREAVAVAALDRAYREDTRATP